MTLAVGTVAPDFTTIDDEGNQVSLSDFKGKVVVMYFYPKDDTPGCTKQAQSFRDSYADYQNKDMVVLGVSMDDQASHQKFKEKYGLPFTLLVDSDGAMPSELLTSLMGKVKSLMLMPMSILVLMRLMYWQL